MYLRSCLLLAVWLCASCGSEEADCADRACRLGQTRCLGNAVATCGDDEQGWKLSSCGLAQHCENGACVARACADLGQGTCQGDDAVQICDERGETRINEQCGADEVCRGGVCVPGGCETGEARCGNADVVLRCVGGAWAAEVCDAGDVCLPAGEGYQCSEQVCEPERRWCSGNTALTCNYDGRELTEEDCGDSRVCLQGECAKPVCGVEYDLDAVDVAGDGTQAVGPASSFIEFRWNSAKNTFDLNARAKYEPGAKNTKISAGKGSRVIEINVKPFDGGVTGSWTEQVVTAAITICYYDGGSSTGGAAGCPEGFSHGSVAYAVSIDDNGGIGGRVVGTFSATMENAAGDWFQLTDGSFDVPHR